MNVTAAVPAWRQRLHAAAPSGASALVAFSAAAVGAGLGRALVTTYLPVLLERIRDAPGLIGTVMLVNTAAGFVVPLVVGAWSDRLRERGHGRTLPFVLGGSLLTAGGLAALALGHASSYLLLALFAAVAYAGLNAVTTGHRALIPENFSSEERAAATAGEEVAMLLGSLAGVVAGGVLIEVEGWAPFALGACLIPLLALPTVRRMRGRERRVEPRQPARRDLRYYARAAATPGARRVLVAQALWVLGYVGLAPFFILYAEHELSLRPRDAALILGGFGIATGIAMLFAGAVKPERQRSVLVAGAVIMGGGLLAVSISSSVAVVAPALLPVAAGFGVLTTLGFPVFATYIPRGEEGCYSALYFSVRSVSSAVAVPAAGWTIALTDSYRSVFALGGVVTLAALIPLLGRAPGGRMLRRGAFLAGATLAVLAGGLLVHETALIEVDKDFFSLLYGIGSSPELVDRLIVDPHIPNYVILAVIAGAAARWSGRGPFLRTALVVGAAGIVSYAMVRLCWGLWERPRPQEVLLIPPANGHDWSGYPSFPSGHVAVTMAIVVAATAMAPVLRAPLWAYAALIAVTRVSYGAHFPSDVAAGLLLGWLAGRAVTGLAAPAAVRRGPAELLFSDAGSARLRALARWTSVVAVAAFLGLLLTQGPPVSPEGGVLGASLERDLQIALLATAAVATAAGWRRDQLGGLLLPVGIALGVLAALQFSPLFAGLACLAFAVPGTLFLLAWPRVRGPGQAAAVAGLVTGLLAAGAVAGLDVYGRAYGPAHPQSKLAAPPTWRVEWMWSGGVTQREARVNARLNTDGRVRLRVGTTRDLRGSWASAVQTADDERNQRLLAFRVRGLSPGTRYFYGLEFDGRLDRNRIGRFQTFAGGRQSFEVAVGACARVGSNGSVFDAVRGEHPLLYLALGDFFYANIEENARGRFLDQYDLAVGSPAQSALYRSTPVAYVWDDHDFGGDASDASAESRPAATWAYRAAVPHYSLPSANGAIYQAFSIGRVRFIVMDTRSLRTPVSMLGATQTRWLERELLAARDRFALTVLVSSVPWIGAAEQGNDSWAGFPAERAALSRFIARHRLNRLVMLAGDAHMLAIDDGSHTDYSGTGRAGFPLMHAAALDRPGHAKGGPYSEGAYPGAGQYGTMRVRDLGSRVDVRLTGRNYLHRRVVSYGFSVRPGG
ncbi:MAG: MFS transporter [Thermoleophilaceae bacterium]|nr:MFS transporter [Thermoleophilaceae bacterium]